MRMARNTPAGRRQASRAAACVPGPDLVTNGAFGSSANWTLSQTGGSQVPTIGTGKLNFTSDIEGNYQKAKQTLAGGSKPAGRYRITYDTTVSGNGLQITLLGASDQDRGSAVSSGSGGSGVVQDVTASGEVSKIQILSDGSGTVDNIKLQKLG